MRLFTGSAPDQYYAVTSRLAARGLQRGAMRVVAVCILVLSLPALFAMTNPGSTRVATGRAVLAVLAVACLGMAAPWLGHRWPTRGQSSFVVVVGSLALGTGCVLATDPLAGLLLATTFGIVVGYTGLFHGWRLRVLTAASAGATLAWLAVQIGREDIPTAVAVVTPVVLVNVLVGYAGRVIGDATAAEAGPADVEPLTGLPTRRAFDEGAGTLLGARSRDDDRYLVVAVIAIDSFAALLSVKGPRGVEAAQVAVGQALRDSVRRDAVLAHVGDAEFLVADTFTTPDPSPLAERIRGAVAAVPDGVTASIGVVSTLFRPLAERPPHRVLEEVLMLATTAMRQARRRGGNTVEYRVEPDLRSD